MAEPRTIRYVADHVLFGTWQRDVESALYVHLARLGRGESFCDSERNQRVLALRQASLGSARDGQVIAERAPPR